MKAAGYQWDVERKRWFRGDASRRVRAEMRSGGRSARFVGGAERETLTDASAPVMAAVRRFGEVVREAREVALGGKDEAMDLQIKDVLSSPLAPLGWLVAQCALLAVAQALLAPQWPSLDAASAQAAALGLVAAPVLCVLRRAQTDAQPGVEHVDGTLERLLVDAALDNHALPAPWSWRAESVKWRAGAAAAELLAGATVAAYVHAGLQAGVASSASSQLGAAAPWLAVAVAALVPLAGAAGTSRPPLDGISAELDAAKLAARTAEAYFLQTAADELDARERAAAAAESAAALRALAAGWQERFGHASEAALRQPLYAGAAGLLSAAIWQLADGAMAAPLVAHACVVADAYVWGCDGSRATVELELPPSPSASQSHDVS